MFKECGSSKPLKKKEKRNASPAKKRCLLGGDIFPRKRKKKQKDKTGKGLPGNKFADPGRDKDFGKEKEQNASLDEGGLE